MAEDIIWQENNFFESEEAYEIRAKRAILEKSTVVKKTFFESDKNYERRAGKEFLEKNQALKEGFSSQKRNIKIERKMKF